MDFLEAFFIIELGR